MVKNISHKVFEQILAGVAEKLCNYGFVRRGPVFRLVSQGNCAIIELQRSDKSTNERVIFTINLGIACGKLLESGPAGAAKARIIDAHLRQRIGMLLPTRPDKWWDAVADPEPVIKEIVELLTTIGIPHLEGFLTTEALISLWESGQSPGLTAVQRDRNLAKLKAVSLQ